MGLPITVRVRRGASPATRFFDLNRSLTGMGVERYASDADTTGRGDRPPDLLARRLFALGVTGVTVYGNVVTVEAPEARWDELEGPVSGAIEHLFEYHGDDAGWWWEARGLEVPVPPAPPGFGAEDGEAAGENAGETTGSGAAGSEAAGGGAGGAGAEGAEPAKA